MSKKKRVSKPSPGITEIRIGDDVVARTKDIVIHDDIEMMAEGARLIRDDTPTFFDITLNAKLISEVKIGMTEKQAIKLSIEHHKRMRLYTKWKWPWSRPNLIKMKKDIGENIGADSCSLCSYSAVEQGYTIELASMLGLDICNPCPLKRKYGACGKKENKNAWMKLIKAKTWMQFIKAENEMIKQLESLL